MQFNVSNFPFWLKNDLKTIFIKNISEIIFQPQDISSLEISDKGSNERHQGPVLT